MRKPDIASVSLFRKTQYQFTICEIGIDRWIGSPGNFYGDEGPAESKILVMSKQQLSFIWRFKVID